MADRRLTGAHYVSLAATITKPNMINIAEMFFGINHEEIENTAASTGNDVMGFNREIIHTWTYRNSGSDQIQVITQHYNAAQILCSSVLVVNNRRLDDND